MSRCYILGAAPIADYQQLPFHPTANDCLICADGGYRHAVQMNLTVNCLVGDFDSQTDGDAPTVVKVRPEKDDTDLQLALELGIKRGYQEFIVAGVLGGRLDHTFAAIQLLVWMTGQGYTCTLIDEQNKMTALYPGTHTVKKEHSQYLSVFSYTERCEGVTICGTKYPLQQGTLTQTYPLGVSNEVTQDHATIDFTDGILLLIQSTEV